MFRPNIDWLVMCTLLFFHYMLYFHICLHVSVNRCTYFVIYNFNMTGISKKKIQEKIIKIVLSHNLSSTAAAAPLFPVLSTVCITHEQMVVHKAMSLCVNCTFFLNTVQRNLQKWHIQWSLMSCWLMCLCWVSDAGCCFSEDPVCQHHHLHEV